MKPAQLAYLVGLVMQLTTTMAMAVMMLKKMLTMIMTGSMISMMIVPQWLQIGIQVVPKI